VPRDEIIAIGGDDIARDEIEAARVTSLRPILGVRWSVATTRRWSLMPAVRVTTAAGEQAHDRASRQFEFSRRPHVSGATHRSRLKLSEIGNFWVRETTPCCRQHLRSPYEFFGQ
jgi:hypothetical protein